MKAILIKIISLAFALVLILILPNHLFSNDFDRSNTLKVTELSAYLPPCPAGEVEVIFTLDMTCSDTDLRPPVVTGPFNNFSGDGNVMVDPDGDDIWEAIICAVPGSTFEYKYAILNFADQENLIDDAIGGAPCPYNTNFFDYSNRLVAIPAGGGPLPIDTYGICGTCDNPPINVTFTVNMNCSDVPPGTPVSMFGAFNGFCCPYGLEDPDGDNIWTTTLPFPPDENGCITMDYLYMAPDFSNIESFLTNGEDLENCPDNINSDFYSFANRIIVVCADTVLDDYWNTCYAPEEPAGGCDDNICDNGFETWDGCECITTMAVFGCTDDIATNYNPNANCDDGSCIIDDCDDPCAPNFGEVGACEPYDMTCNDDCTLGPFGGIWDANTCSCINETTPIEGCTDNTACNYDPIVNCDDGNCDFGIPGCIEPCNPGGCTDNAACNFSPDACIDDGSCDFGNLDCVDPCNPIMGCTDPLTCTYNPDACIDDGSCNTESGCTDNTACNFDINACVDDGLCDYGNLACPDPCNEPTNIDDGCNLTTDSFDAATCTVINEPNCPAETTFNPATCTCDTDVILGCTDSCADNFNPNAEVDDGSCNPYDDTCNQDCNVGPFGGTWDPVTCDCINEITPVFGCTDDTYCEYNPDANCDDGTCITSNGEPGTCDDGDCINGIETWDYVTCTCVTNPPPPESIGCTDTNACNYNPDASCDDGTCDFGNAACTDPCNPIVGCMDASACNYNPDACSDDGSCELPPCNPGCTDPCADNYDATADEDDGSCNPYDMTCNMDCLMGNIEVWDSVNCECIVDVIIMTGCTDPEANNYDPNANCDDGTCILIMCDDPCAPNFGALEACEPYDTTCNDDCSLGSFGGSWDPAACTCINQITPVIGCTDPLSTNYNPDANCDDGSCFCEEEIVGSIIVPDEGCDVSGLEVMIMAPDGTSITVTTDANGSFTVPGGPFLCGTYSATITDANVPACFTETGNIGPVQFEVDGEGNGDDGPFFFSNPAVPTLSQWGLMILGLLLMTFGALKLGFQNATK